MEAVPPSGFLAAPSQSPVKGSGATTEAAVEVGVKGVGEAGVPCGEAQAASRQSRIRDVEVSRIDATIDRSIKKIPLQMGGISIKEGPAREPGLLRVCDYVPPTSERSASHTSVPCLPQGHAYARFQDWNNPAPSIAKYFAPVH